MKNLTILAFFKNLFPAVMEKGSLPTVFTGFTLIGTVLSLFTGDDFPTGCVFFSHGTSESLAAYI